MGELEAVRKVKDAAMDELQKARERIEALEAALKVAGEALEEMQYARTDKAERLTEEAIKRIKEVSSASV